MEERLQNVPEYEAFNFVTGGGEGIETCLMYLSSKICVVIIL